MLTNYAPKWSETQGDWVCDFYESGRRHRWRLGIRDSKKQKVTGPAAELRYRQLLNELLAKTSEDGDVIFAEAVRNYDASEEQRRKLANALEHFEAVPVSKISKESFWKAGRKHFPNGSLETVGREFVGPAHAAINQQLGSSPVRRDDRRRERFLLPDEAAGCRRRPAWRASSDLGTSSVEYGKLLLS
ncbi:hypothetical protein CLV78_111143 [Aliiruegeria haliotis]|uniref:Uncharacterized protein n=1 Tax=Aliiruegeria haliotis TaxID=1280846 RepID=A0A2T0RIN2_9RHOB|nr:hypothetical protein [Aliiruegeria haliotis]PRY20987.1 hypothetical protein CLV78_111143 [Aliiruegeria haliotis]